MIYREFKIKNNNHDEPICYSCLLKTVTVADSWIRGLRTDTHACSLHIDLAGFRNDPKKLAEDFIQGYVRDGEGTINCYRCGPVRYERFGDGWVEVRNAVTLQ